MLKESFVTQCHLLYIRNHVSVSVIILIAKEMLKYFTTQTGIILYILTKAEWPKVDQQTVIPKKTFFSIYMKQNVNCFIGENVKMSIQNSQIHNTVH